VCVTVLHRIAEDFVILLYVIEDSVAVYYTVVTSLNLLNYGLLSIQRSFKVIHFGGNRKPVYDFK